MSTNIAVLLVVAALVLLGVGLYFIPRYLQKKKDIVFGDGLATPSADGTNPAACFIGPIVRGENYSVGMPAHPSPLPDGQRGWFMDFPVPSQPFLLMPNMADKHVHSVTFNPGPLTGKKQIRVKGRIEADADAQVRPKTDPQLPSQMTVWFQRKDDTWSGVGEYETYRWYATFHNMMPIVPGDFEFVLPLDDKWTAIETSSRESNPTAFQAALDNTVSLGLGFGGGDGVMHGAFATGHVRLIVTDFVVE